MKLRNHKPRSSPSCHKSNDEDNLLIINPSSSSSPPLRLTQRDYELLLQKQKFVAYSHTIQQRQHNKTHHSTNTKNTPLLYPGMSSAASCIVISLPKRPDLPTNAPIIPPVTKKRSRRGIIIASPSSPSSPHHKQVSLEPTTQQLLSWHASHANISRFKPVYTHQFFVEERMRGYRPNTLHECEVMSLLSSPSTSSSPVNSSLLGGADNNKEEEEVATLHESFTYHTVARYELSIEVRLAPSCRRSCIVVNVGKVESGNVGGNAANANANANGSAMYSQGGVKQVLDLSKEEDEVNASVDTTVDDSIVRNASKKRGRPRRVTPEDSTTTTESVRKSRRVHINQTVTRRSNRRRMNQVVSSDESEEDHAVVMSDDVKPARPPIAVRRSGRTCIPSKRSLFSIDEELEDVSSDDNKSKSSQCKTSRANNITTSSNKGTTRQNNQLHYTPAFTRSMSSQSNDSMCTYTGDICLDGGKMKVETIVKHLTRGLPTVDAVLLYDGETYSVVRHDDKTKKSLSSTIETIDEIENDYLDEPIGKAFRSYTAEKRPMTIWDSGGIEPPSCQEEEDAAFVLSLADMRYDNDARRYHDEVEKLAPWWIETADCVHMGSTGGINDRGVRGGHWKVLYLFERHAMKPSHPVRRFGQAKPIRGKASKAPPTLKYSLAGYMTILFHQKKMVVCQVLILPPYQRSGHGLNLMRAAYESLAFGNMITDPISEINVELPGKAFVCLRDKIDYHFVRHFMTDTFTKRNLWDVSDEYTEPVILSARGKASLNVLPDEVIEKMSTSLKITLRQCQIAYEIWLLGKIEEFIKSKLGNSDVSELNKQIATLEGSYKFIVKRSLLRVLREKDERFNCLCIEEQQEKLEDSFVSTVCHYRTFL